MKHLKQSPFWSSQDYLKNENNNRNPTEVVGTSRRKGKATASGKVQVFFPQKEVQDKELTVLKINTCKGNMRKGIENSAPRAEIDESF